MRATMLLTNRDSVNLAQLRDYLVGVLSTGQAEIINEVLYVDGTNGNAAYDGKRPDRAFKTITQAYAVAAAYDVIAVFPGTYAEHIAWAGSNVTLLGLGSKPKDVHILDATAGVTTAMLAIVGSNNVVSNLRIGNGHANCVANLSLLGSDNLVEGCEFVKYASVANDVGVELIGPATNLNNEIRNCLFNGCTNGVIFTADTTQAKDQIIRGCTFKNGVTTDIFDVTDVAVDGVLIDECVFLGIPTKFIEIDSAACAGGMISNCTFNSATHATTIDIDNGIIPVCNRTLAGISVAVPA